MESVCFYPAGNNLCLFLCPNACKMTTVPDGPAPLRRKALLHNGWNDEAFMWPLEDCFAFQSRAELQMEPGPSGRLCTLCDGASGREAASATCHMPHARQLVDCQGPLHLNFPTLLLFTTFVFSPHACLFASLYPHISEAPHPCIPASLHPYTPSSLHPHTLASPHLCISRLLCLSIPSSLRLCIPAYLHACISLYLCTPYPCTFPIPASSAPLYPIMELNKGMQEEEMRSTIVAPLA